MAALTALLATVSVPFTAPKVPAQSPSDRNIIIPIDVEIETPDGRSFRPPNPAVFFPVTEFTPQEAIDYFQQTLESARRENDRSGEGNALLYMGIAYSALGEFTQDRSYTYKGLDFYLQSLAIYRELKDEEGEARSLYSLGNNLYILGEFSQALNFFQTALERAEKLKIYDLYGNAIVATGRIYSELGNFNRALEYQQQGLAVARKIQSLPHEWNALSAMGMTLFQLGKLSEATESLFAAIQVFESMRSSLGNTDAQKVAIGEILQSGSHRLLQKVLVAQNKFAEALEIAERGRAPALLELLGSRLNRTVSFPRLQDFQRIAKERNATLVEYAISHEDYREQGFLRSRESELFIWVIKPTGEVAFRSVSVPQGTSVRTLIPNTIELIREGTRGTEIPLKLKPGDLVRLKGKPAEWEYEVIAVDVEKGTVMLKFPNTDRPPKEYPMRDVIIARSLNYFLQELHQLLITPIADLLPSNPNAHVIFIPQRELSAVPFAALQDAAGNYLIQKHTVLTAPGIQVLDFTQELRQRVAKNPSNEVLVVGNPTMPEVSFAPGERPKPLPALPNATIEANAVARLLSARAITGKDATKAAVAQLLPKAKIIHLATHGLLDEVSGLGSAIALAPSANDSGFLTAEEILSLNLNAELVVLSACDTGKGRITGDGIIGLSRSLISAGVPSVILSLWQVPDAPTAELMTAFYQNLKQNPDKARALRSAMLTTMQQHPDPKNWAAFTLIGEAE